MILSKEIFLCIVLYFCDNFYSMSLSFQTEVASRGFHIYKSTTWENVNIGQESSVKLESLETNEDSKKIDSCCCAIKNMISRKLETVGHMPREVSRYAYLYIKEEGVRIDGSDLSTRYRPSRIRSGGLEISLMMTFRSPRYITHQKMKDFMTRLYFYDHKPVTENVESDSNSDEFHIKIKVSVVEEGEEREVVVNPKAKNRKVRIACNSICMQYL